MKIIAHKIAQAIFFICIAVACVTVTSCKDDKDSCEKCEEEKAIENQANADSVAEANNSTEIVKNNSSSAGLKAKNAPAKSSDNSNSTGENGENVSIINPNEKSNSDSKRTYGSSGTGGGSGTSGSGGDGNGSTGWNADAKKGSN